MEAQNCSRLEKWHIQSSDTPGFHAVITPEQCECHIAQIFRLNLLRGQRHHLKTGNLEMHPVLISGSAFLSPHRGLKQTMKQFDSFYLPACDDVIITATSDCIFYIAAATYEGIGAPSFRQFNYDLPLINECQIKSTGKREIMFTLDPDTPASHLVCSLIQDGSDSQSIPPPNLRKMDTEEIFCYFDTDFSLFNLVQKPSVSIASSTIRSGTMVQVPAGCKQIANDSRVQNTYLWVMASYTPRQRKYDLRILDSIYN